MREKNKERINSQVEVKRTQEAVDGLDEALVEVVDVGGGPAAIAREELHAHGAPGAAVAHSLFEGKEGKPHESESSLESGLQVGSAFFFFFFLGGRGKRKEVRGRGNRGLTSRKSLAIAWFEGAAAAEGDGGETGARWSEFSKIRTCSCAIFTNPACSRRASVSSR